MKLPKFSLKRKKSDPDQAEATSRRTGPVHDSTTGVKQWFLLHLEKPVFFLALLLLGLLVYGAIGKLQPQIGESPEELTKRAAQLETKINHSTWNESSYLAPDFSTMIETARRKVRPDEYSFESLVGPTANTSGKRTRPEFLPAKTPWAVAGNGIFWVKGERPGGEGAADDDEQNAYPSNLYQGVGAPADAVGEVRRWVSITAVVPVSEQRAIYERYFSNAEGYNQNQDLPKYLLARLQRVEVSPGDTEKELIWPEPDPWFPDTSKQQVPPAETAQGRLFFDEHDHWAATAPEIVDPKFVHGQLTARLGPLAYQRWDRWATHPQIPLKATKPVQRKQPPRRGRDRGPPVDNNPGLRDRNAPGAGNRPPPEHNPRLRRRPVNEKPREDPAQETPVKNSVDTKGVPVAAENAQLLVRLFDFDVEAGKTYRYRVQLLLENPNYEQPARFLKNPGDRKSRETPDAWLEWSAPTAPVRVPQDTQVYVARFASGEEATSEEDQLSAVDKDEQATLVVQTLDPVTGEVVTGRDTFVRGNVVVLDDEDETLRENRLAAPHLVAEQTPLKTDLVLLDLYSGHTPQGKAPIEMLFLDSQGNIFWRDSVSDQAVTGQFNRLQQYFEATKAQNAQQQAKTIKGNDAAGKDELLNNGNKKKNKGNKKNKRR